jgi:hypothetical protein
MRRYKKIAYCTPTTYKDVGGIIEYFINNTQDFYLYLYPPSYNNQPSLLIYYKYGKVIKSEKIWIYKGGNKILIHLFYYLFYLYFLVKYKINHAYILFHFPIFLLFGSVIELTTSNKYVFWIWDYFPNPKGIMKAYNSFVFYYNSKLKYVIYLSPEIEKIYNLEKNSNKFRQIVSLGIKNIRLIRKPTKNVIGYIGNLRPGQGLEFLLDIIKSNKNLKLQLIGDGPLKSELEESIKENHLGSRVDLFGFIDNEHIINIVNKWKVAVAPYAPSLDSPVHYADPSKIKLYIQYEMPVIMTRVSHFYKELVRYRAGIAIDLNSKSFVHALKTINGNYKEYSRGVIGLKKKHLYDSYYRNKFRFLM